MKRITIGLVGNPNCGKTTLLNALTGTKQQVGNWPGVTVERKSGTFSFQQTVVEVVDLPGTYSLISTSHSTSLDEHIAYEFIASHEADIIINVIDASNLERNLYLTAQLLEMQVPVILAINMLDIAKQKQNEINLSLLAEKLDCSVVGLELKKNKGIAQLKAEIIKTSQQQHISTCCVSFPPEVDALITQLISKIEQESLSQTPRALALRLLEDDNYARKLVSHATTDFVDELKKQFSIEYEDTDIVIADARYGFVHELAKAVTKKSADKYRSITTWLDRIVLNRFLGIPIFLAIMYCMFFFAINIGGVLQNFFDISSNLIFVQGLAHFLNSFGLPNWFIEIATSGAGKGISTTITFIPIIGGMFLFLSFLEASGYMARAAFVMDRLMRALGLPGKSFVPLIIGFGCNVPAVMAARTLNNKRDRVLTIMMSPFMSCGARLTIYSVFTAAFFPVGGQNIVFSLYLIGIAMAMLTGFILRKTLLQGEPSPFVMELPSYHLPTFKRLFNQTWARLKNFLFRAVKVIVPVCILISALNSLTVPSAIHLDTVNQHSLLAELGRVLTPIFAPMGLQQDNWPATVGLITGTLAKEVVIGTLNTLYTQGGHSINPSVYGVMSQHFSGQIGAFAYLLFILLYIPCVSTVAVIARELSKGWAIFSLLWSTGLAYGVAVFFYQAATFAQHPQSALFWMIGISAIFIVTVIVMRWYARVSILNCARNYDSV